MIRTNIPQFSFEKDFKGKLKWMFESYKSFKDMCRDFYGLYERDGRNLEWQTLLEIEVIRALGQLRLLFFKTPKKIHCHSNHEILSGQLWTLGIHQLFYKPERIREITRV